jgi:predicted acylesterase/phospholipase RssA
MSGEMRIIGMRAHAGRATSRGGKNNQGENAMSIAGKAALAGLAAGVISLAALAAPPRDATRRNPYALTISGGVSLGAYEAGINWALLRYLKTTKAATLSNPDNLYPELVAVTGASAGSINGLVSAITWCADPVLAAKSANFADRIDDNLFRDVWLPVGLDQLLPAGAVTDYEPHGDGLFTRRAFDGVISRIRKTLDEPIYDMHCQLPFGVTVTSETPYTRVVSNVRVNNQRHFIPLTFEVSEKGRGRFRSRPVDYANPGFGNVIHLPPGRNVRADTTRYDVDNEAVINAVLASSAFPLAFGRRTVDYCYLPGHATSARDNKAVACPAPLVGARDVFLDGGIFDNIPLGAAQALAEGQRAEVARRVTYVFMDPDNRRPAVEADEPAKPLTGISDLNYDITSQFGFLGGTVNTARSYELYKVLTSGDWTSQIGSRADYLLRIIDALPETRRSTPPAGGCQAFFAALDTPGAALDARRIEHARFCLNDLKVETERAYQRPDLTDAQLRAERRKGIGNLRAVSTALRRSQTRQWWLDQLAHFDKALTALASAPLSDRRVLLSSRYFPITGEYLHAFGAFFDKPFREFDYYAGVYDAMHGIAQYWCEVRIDLAKANNCIATQLQAIFRQLEIAGDARAEFIIGRLARLEHPEHREPASGWDWLPPPAVTPATIALGHIMDAMAEPDLDHPDQYKSVEFPAFVENLRALGYGDAQTSVYFRDIKDQGKEWWELPAARAARRLHTLELATEQRTGTKGGFTGTLGTTATAAEFYNRGLPSVALRQQTTASAWWPREIGIGASQSDSKPMPYGSWEYRLFVLDEMARWPSLHVTPVQYVPEADKSSVAQVGLRANYSNNGFRLGAGPDLNFLWHRHSDNEDRFGIGFSVFADLGPVRITIGRRDLNGDMFAPEHKNYLNIAVLNLGDWLSGNP